MGTWSHEVFGNDTACDWAAELAEGNSLAPVEAALAAVAAAPPGVLDADLAMEALAAAEATARLRGWPGERSAYTEALDDWVTRTRLQPPAALVQAALVALDRVGGADSELHELWAESADVDAWRQTVQDLRQRLVAPPRAPQPAAHPAAHPAAPSGPVQRVLGRLEGLRFELPQVSAQATVAAWYQRAVAAAALGDTAAVCDAVQVLWQPVARMDKPAIAFDLAVRDAQALAMEGRLDEALDGMQAWRAAPGADAPGMFDMRASGICQAAGDLDAAQALRTRALADAPQQLLWRLDEPLLQARAASAEVAQAQLDALGDPLGDLSADPALAMVDRFIRGVLACRRSDPAALDLLAPVAEEFADKCVQGAAAWSLASAALGWWALALAQAGQADEARAVADAIRPTLLQRHNALLVDALLEAGVLPPGTAVPAAPPRVAWAGAPTTHHGTWRSVALRGVNAWQWLHAERRRFAEAGGAYPFLIGDDRALEHLLGMAEPPPDAGRATLEAAAAVDAAAWLKEHGPRRKPAWPRNAPGPHPTPRLQFDAVTQQLLPVLHVGLIELSDPCELFARLGWGGWNDCPPPAVHVALHRHWRERFGAEPVALSGDTVECTVARPPQAQDAALALAREHQGYCPDAVEQGSGTTGRLAATLLAAPCWYFWWD